MTDTPRPPRLPVLSSGSVKWRRGSRGPLPSLLDAGEVHYLRRGRTAMDAAYRLMGLGPGDEVLLPAYHCVSMVEPVLRTGATPVFYQLLADTAVNVEDLKSKINASTRAAVFVHYFGFHQRIAELRSLCDEYGIAAIEDCAHCFFGSVDGKPVGSFGHFAIGSPWKFLPIMEGGCLVINEPHFRMVPTEKAGARAELKSFLNNIERSLDHRRLRATAVLFRPLIALARIRSGSTSSLSTEPDPRVADTTPASSIPGLTRISRYLIEHCDTDRCIRTRRRHYEELHNVFSTLKRAHPLHPGLPENVVPQVYPLVMDNPEQAFPRLLEAGVPVIRFGEYLWERMDDAVCEVTRHLSRAVFQIPCHQELSGDDLKWLAETVRRATDG